MNQLDSLFDDDPLTAPVTPDPRTSALSVSDPDTDETQDDPRRRELQKQVNNALWRACDTFRGVIDPEAYKSYVLVMLFFKYVSDVWTEHRDVLMQKYEDDEQMVERMLARDRFVLPPDTGFADVYRQYHATNLGEVIDIALQCIEDANPGKLDRVFRNISFNSDNLGEARERNARLRHLLDDFAALDLRPSRVGEDVVGQGYMFLIEKFAAGAGKKAGEFFTPVTVSRLLAKLVRAQPGDRICDPTCGSGALLIRVAEEIEPDAFARRDYSLFGQEMNGSTWALCRMNMFLHGQDSAVIKWGDTLRHPQLIEADRLMRFDVVVANPPFSLDKWGADSAEADLHNRFRRGIPPRSKGDFAFILHMVETALPGEGRVGVICPHGVLFRGGSEGKIRQSLIDDNLLDAVVGLPQNLFFGTGIPAVVLLFDRSREAGGANEARQDVLFIDASREFQASKNQNELRNADIARVARTHYDRAEETRYSRRVPVSEIVENGYNLNIPRYIDTFEARPDVDLPALKREITQLEAQLTDVRAKLDSHLQLLGVG